MNNKLSLVVLLTYEVVFILLYNIMLSSMYALLWYDVSYWHVPVWFVWKWLLLWWLCDDTFDISVLRWAAKRSLIGVTGIGASLALHWGRVMSAKHNLCYASVYWFCSYYVFCKLWLYMFLVRGLVTPFVLFIFSAT